MKLILILLLTQTACAQPAMRYRPLVKYIRVPAPTPAPQKPKIVYNEVTNNYNYECSKRKGK